MKKLAPAGTVPVTAIESTSHPMTRIRPAMLMIRMDASGSMAIR